MLIFLCSLFILAIRVRSELLPRSMNRGYNYPCASFMVTSSPLRQGIFLRILSPSPPLEAPKIEVVHNKANLSQYQSSSADDGGIIRFRSASDLLRLVNDTRVEKMLASMSCIIIIVDVSSDNEISQLIDMVDKWKIARKQMIISIPRYNDTCLDNKTINFNVLIYHQKGPGGKTTS